MARTRSPAARKHRRLLRRTKGYRQARSSRYRSAKEALAHSGQYAYIGRKLRKRDLRRLWITRISAAVKMRGTSYNRFISALKKGRIELDRKMLADIAVRDRETFDKIFEKAMKGDITKDGSGNNKS